MLLDLWVALISDPLKCTAPLLMEFVFWMHIYLPMQVDRGHLKCTAPRLMASFPWMYIHVQIVKVVTR